MWFKRVFTLSSSAHHYLAQHWREKLYLAMFWRNVAKCQAWLIKLGIGSGKHGQCTLGTNGPRCKKQRSVFWWWPWIFFLKTSYVFLIMSELQSKFPDCDDFSLDDWRNVKTFKRFGMPRQSTDGQLIGSGICGVGVILAALDFMTSSQPQVVWRSWNFSEMTAHRKDIMKLLACR